MEDVKNILLNMVEQRFKEVASDLAKKVEEKRKAIEGRKSILDRLHVQVRNRSFIDAQETSLRKRLCP